MLCRIPRKKSEENDKKKKKCCTLLYLHTSKCTLLYLYEEKGSIISDPLQCKEIACVSFIKIK